MYIEFLIVLLAAFCCLQACPPTTPQPSQGNTNKTRRDVDVVKVILVSNQIFDPVRNDNHLQVFRALMDDYMKTKGVIYSKDLVKEQIKNENGMFAVLFIMMGYDCNGVSKAS
ncbi:hypothetical protein OESDEN_19743 [Oesophagostomum dentatum]|uniref:Uncharacterized protein n=1 Tax=Oesophagostomum dentatum TaxID=61180 RepID=A0A0B1S6M9_OESDE|nr:hypothetical protein OESDEN_19743 [Oesophagostomum dentatum]